MLDILIRGGLVADGTGGELRPADVAISSGRVAAVGRLEGAQAEEVIDASGLVVCPGFIDMHSHSDLSLVSHPGATSSLLQGITTEVAGSCGWSLAPVKAETSRGVLKGLCEGLLGEVPPGLAFDEDGRGLAWYSFGEYLDHVGRSGLGVNLYPVVGQSLIRAHVVGTDRRPATPGEIEAMRELLKACLAEGARGLSTGRAYAPGGHASTEEVIALCRVVAERGGLYSTHIKNESDGLVEAVAEAIRIGRESGVRVEVSHHKAVGRANYGRVGETLAMMEEARSQGVDVTCDVYPYAFAQVFSLLAEVPGVSATQTDQEIAGMLAREEFRAKVTAELGRALSAEAGAPGFISRPEQYLVVSVGRDHDLEGRTLPEVLGPSPLAGWEKAKGRGEEPDRELVRIVVERSLDLLLAQDLHVHLAAMMSEDDVSTVLRHPETMVGTDAFALDRELGPRTPIHPRHYGTFPRVLGPYRRERGLGDLGDVVRKLTALPARKLRLVDRGLLARGLAADVVVFDPETIADRATARDPYRPPVGVRWVIVNGRVAVRDGRPTGVRAGLVLRG